MKPSAMTVVLAAVNLTLAALLVSLLLAGTQREAIMRSERDAPAVPDMDLSLPQPSADVGSIQVQSVFHISRSFYVAPAPGIVEAPAPDYKLTGSMSIPGRGRTAVLTHAQTNARVKVAVGDVLEAWTVQEIGSRAVTLVTNGRTIEISAAGSNAGSATATATDSALSTPLASVDKTRAPTAPSYPAATHVRGAPANTAPRLYRPPTR
jgi:hypothetical protein